MFGTLRDTLWAPEPVIAVQQFFGDGWNWLFQGLTLLGASPGVAILVAVAFWLMGHRFAWRVAGILILTATTNAILWNTVGVPRPDDPRIVHRATVSVTSFPSGHTASATALWGLLAALGYVPALLVLLIVGAVMLSRLYLGVHYLGDVLGGVLVGLIALAIYTRLHEWFVRRTSAFGRALAEHLGRFTFVTALAIGIGAAVAALVVLGPSQKGWEISGAILGLGIALPVEVRYLDYRPALFGRAHLGMKVAVGLAGLGILGLIKPLAEGAASACVFALAPIWMILIAPAIFTTLERRWQSPHAVNEHPHVR